MGSRAKVVAPHAGAWLETSGKDGGSNLYSLITAVENIGCGFPNNDR